MELLLLYFWLKLDIIIGLLVAIACFAAAAIGILKLWATEPYYEDIKKERHTTVFVPWSKKLLALGLFGLFGACFIPDKTDTAILLGGHYALKAVNTPEAAKVMSVMRKKANEILDKELAK